MVRMKAKARKGDEAFQTRKQKVGRKKLAPATATRAEVHARTLRVTTPLSIVHAKTDEASVMAAEKGGRSRQQRHHQEKGKEGVPAVSAEKLHRDFKEQLSNTRHYKKAMRGAGFMSLVRAIAANYEFIDAAAQSSSRVSSSDLSDERFLTPLEILSAFTSALDAMCDTDSDVRSAALATIKIILQPPSSHSSYSSLSPSRGCGVEAGGVRLDGPAVAVGGSSPVACNVDRVRAVLSVVDVTLTHAMVSVRRDGVELLHLILQVSPSDVRAVLSESDAWVKMASRVSSLLLQGSIAGGNSSGAVKTVKLIHVVPAFLETMLLQRDSVDNVLVGEGSGGGGGFSHVQMGEKDVNNTEVSAALICELFEECSPKWSMEWKELMEMRSAIFRDADRVQRATAIARAFACISMYLRERRLLNKSKVKLIRHLFTVKMPFTMQELTLAAAASASSDSFGGNNNNHNKSSNSRMELANAIADACLPISDSANDVSQLIRDFLSTSLSGRNINGGGGGSNNKLGAMQLLGPLRTLRTALIKFPTTLLPRLLFLAQPMMQTVTQAVDIKDDSTWVEAALLAADVLAVTLTSQAAVTSKQCLSFLRAAVLSVPRLLFSIRGKADAAMVDRIVWAFLQILWRLVSSGHPLMLQTLTSSSFSTTTTTTTTTTNNNNNNNNNNTADGDSTTAQLVLSLPSLFEIRVPDAATPGAYISLDGVLARCTGRTRELAVHLLFYLQAAAPCTDATPVVHTSLADTLPC